MKCRTSICRSLTLLFTIIVCLSGRAAAAVPPAPSLVSPADGAVISEPFEASGLAPSISRCATPAPISTATAGGGAWQGERKLSVSDIGDPAFGLIGTGFPFKDPSQLPVYQAQFARVSAATTENGRGYTLQLLDRTASVPRPSCSAGCTRRAMNRGRARRCGRSSTGAARPAAGASPATSPTRG